MAVSALDHLDAILLSLFNRIETIPGKKALQKIVYFFKETGVGIPFAFQWDKFGPYSSDLATYTEDLVAEGLMTSEAKKVFSASEEGRGVQYNFRLGTRAKQLLSSQGASSGEKEGVDRVVALLKEVGPANLELYATVHYVVKYFSTKSERGRFPKGLFELVNDYKPGRFGLDQINGAYFNLKKLHWIS